MDKYRNIELVNENEKIFVCENIDSNETCAIKKIKLSNEIGIPLSAIREIRLLKKLKSDKIVELKNIFFEKMFLYLVFEFYPLNLATLIEEGFYFSDDHIRSLAYQLLLAVNCIHSKGFIHRNIHPGHILLNRSGNLKLIGFSSSRQLADKMTNNITSLRYRAPELLLGDISYNNKIDSWSIAMILLELRLGHPVFEGNSEIQQCKLILSALGSPNIRYPWNDLYQIDKYQKQETWDSIINDRFGGLICDKLLRVVKELLILNKYNRLSVENTLMLSTILAGQNTVVSYYYNTNKN